MNLQEVQGVVSDRIPTNEEYKDVNQANAWFFLFHHRNR